MTIKRQERMKSVLNNRQSGIIVLEDVHDPHNAAAVLRSCDAFGFQTAYFVFNSTKPYNPKQVGKVSSASANKWLTIRTFSSSEEALGELLQQQYTIYATALHEEKSIDLYTPLPSLGPRVAIVLGNEHAGVSELVCARAHHLLYIPMRGFVESFNISVAAAIILAEVTRQRKAAGPAAFGLPPPQKEELAKQWGIDML